MSELRHEGLGVEENPTTSATAHRNNWQLHAGKSENMLALNILPAFEEHRFEENI